MPEASTPSLRVLHINAGNMIGGVESVLLTLAEFANTCPSFHQEFALAFDAPFAESLRATGALVHLLPEAQLRNLLSVRRSRHALRKLLQGEKYDVVISHSIWCQVVYGPVPLHTNVPLIFWMHNDFDGHWLQCLASRYSPQFAICNSEFTRSSLPRVYPETRSEVIHYPIRPLKPASVERCAMRQQLGAGANTAVILMASRMDSWKGHLNLLRATAEIKTDTDWTVWIAGAPQTAKERAYFGSVQNTVQQLHLTNRVKFLGQRSDVPNLMRACDIFCQPNKKPEPFGVVFVEALQAGVPVVTYRMGGAQEILDGNSGWMVPPENIDALKTALTSLIEDPPLRRKLGTCGPLRAELLCDPARQIRRVHETLLPICRKN